MLRRRLGGFRRLFPGDDRLPDAEHAGSWRRRQWPRPDARRSFRHFSDAKGLAISRHETISKDGGTDVPYFEVARKDLTKDGRNPTLLNGYGGFEIPMLPSYRPTFGVAWLEQGGVYVLANIRGGGEFGPKWHQSALKCDPDTRLTKTSSQSPQDLVSSREGDVLPPGPAMGGATAACKWASMLTHQPDLFGAIVCGWPLPSNERGCATWSGAVRKPDGRSMGNPDVPEDWTYIHTFCALSQRSERSGPLPTHAVHDLDSRDDQNVHPGHAL